MTQSGKNLFGLLVYRYDEDGDFTVFFANPFIENTPVNVMIEDPSIAHRDKLAFISPMKFSVLRAKTRHFLQQELMALFPEVIDD